jgi:phage shock protein PspC (stress-responsive transcriptional regulator)
MSEKERYPRAVEPLHPETAAALQAATDDEADAAIVALAKIAVRLAYRRKRMTRAFAAVSLVAGAAVMWYRAMPPQLALPATAVLTVLAALPLLLAFLQKRSERGSFAVCTRHRAPHLLGVCLGLSAAWGVSVWLVRTAFVALACAAGLGAVIYLGLAVVLPVHPEDRAGLWRFRIERQFRRLLT